RQTGAMPPSSSMTSSPRSASTHGPKGSACSLSYERPSRTRPPPCSALVASSATTRVLPMPASPMRVTSRPCPSSASLRRLANRSISAARPMRGTSRAETTRREEVALVERGGLRQCLGRTFGHQPREGRDIDIDHGAVQRQPLALEHERRRLRLAKCLANREECLAQARPGRLVPNSSPEQCCK